MRLLGVVAHHFAGHADYVVSGGDALEFGHQLVFEAGDYVGLAGGEGFEAYAGDFFGGLRASDFAVWLLGDFLEFGVG